VRPTHHAEKLRDEWGTRMGGCSPRKAGRDAFCRRGEVLGTEAWMWFGSRGVSLLNLVSQQWLCVARTLGCNVGL
jgi:hypothetical protein